MPTQGCPSWPTLYIQLILKFNFVADSELGILHYGQCSKIDNIQINHAKTMSVLQNAKSALKGVKFYPFDALDAQNLSVKRKGSSILTKKFNFLVQKAQKRSNQTAWQISNPAWVRLCLIQTVKLFLIMGLIPEIAYFFISWKSEFVDLNYPKIL